MLELGRQRSSAGAPNDIPKLVDENGKASELVETNYGYVTCYIEHPLRNGDILDLKCDQWTKALSEIFLTYTEPKSASKLSVGMQKITLTGKSTYFLLVIKDAPGKLKVIEKKSRKEETLNVEKEPCWVCFRLKCSRIKMLGTRPALRDRTTSFERSESDFEPTSTGPGPAVRDRTISSGSSVKQTSADESDLVVTQRASGSLESAKPPSIRRVPIPVIQFARDRIIVVNQEIEERKKQQDIVAAELRDLKVQQQTLVNQLKRNQVEQNKKLAILHEVQGQMMELKHEQEETVHILKNE